MALPDAFEAYLLAVYANWYALPRWSSRAPLDEMRKTLAAALATGESGAQAVDAVYAFVEQSRRLPAVAEATERVFADQTASVSLRGILRPPSLSDTAATSLTDLLRQTDPPGHAIRLLSFIPGREQATFQAVRDHLEKGATRFPDATQAMIADIFARVDRGELDAKGALQELEQSADVLRVAWAEFLAGKTDKILRTLGVTGPPPPAAAPASPADAAPAGAGVSTQYFTDVRFPAKIKRSERYPLLVRLTLNRDEASIAEGTVEVEFDDPAKPEALTVVLTATGFDDAFTRPGANPQRTMMVQHQQDSEPVVFWIKADELGQKQISIDFYHADKLVGGTRFVTEVVTTAPSGTAQVKMEAAETELELRFKDLPQPADLELRVTYDRVNQTLAYMLHSTKGEVVYHFSNMGAIDLGGRDAEEFFEESFDFMGEIAAFAAEDLDAEDTADFQRKIEQLGMKLFEELLPPPLQEAYWNIKDLRDQDKIRSLLITTDEPWIPWELIRPYAYDAFKDEEKSDEFWGSTFQVSRWLSGPGPFERLNVRDVSLIVPDTDLIHAEEEGAGFEIMRGRGVRVGEPLANKADVMRVITEGSAELLHFATHASFDAEDPDRSPVSLEDDELTPADLDPRIIRKLRSKRPIVFLNACRSGRIGFRLTGMDGWADRVVKQMRATAFIGTLWEVHDELAAQFAARFYSELLVGKTLGEAFHTARLQIRDAAPANPTWLAYTLYGDPNTRVTWGEQD